MNSGEASLTPLKDEKAYLLEELVGPDPRPGRGMRRWQCITVNRNDTLVKYKHDMGPAKSFTAPQLQVLGYWEMTVGELQDIADTERDRLYWQNFLRERQAESTLVEDYLKQQERMRNWIKGRSIYGPAFKVQNIR